MDQTLMRWPRASEASCTEAGVAPLARAGLAGAWSPLQEGCCQDAPLSGPSRTFDLLWRRCDPSANDAPVETAALPGVPSLPDHTSASVPTVWSAWPFLGLKDLQATAARTTLV